MARGRKERMFADENGKGRKAERILSLRREWLEEERRGYLLKKIAKEERKRR